MPLRVLRTPRLPRETLSTGLLLLSTFLICSLAVWLGVRVAGHGGSVISGAFPARVEGQAAVRSLRVPGLYTTAGIPGQSVVTHELPVEVLPHLPDVAVYLERVRYAAELEWDGVPIGSIGAFDADGLRMGNDGSHVFRVPAALAGAGTHSLRLTVAGIPFEGGIIGEVRVGAERTLLQLQRWKEFERLGIYLVGAFSGLVHLSVALRRRGRDDHLWYGLFMSALAVYMFAQSDSWYDAVGFDTFELRLRVRRLALVASLAFAALVASVSAFEKPDRVARGIVWSAMLIGLCVAWPFDLRGAAIGNHGADALSVVVVAHFLSCVTLAWRAGRPGAGALAAAASVGSIAILMDVSVSRGWIAGSPLVVPSMLGVLGAVATVISVRDADVHDRFEALVRQASDGILLVRRDGTVSEANASAAQLLDLPVDAVPGQSLRTLVSPESEALMHDHLVRAGRTADRIELRTRGEHAGRVESLASPLHDGEVLVMLRDVTERRRMEEALLRAARMESVGQLAGGVAHDFNNVLGGILGQVNLLRLRFREHAELDQRLERLERSIQRATGLCRRLVTLARGGSPVRQRLAPAVVIEQAMELVRPAAGGLVRLEVAVDPDLPEVHVVPSEIEEALLNLVLNARDSMPDGGVVSLRATRHEDGIAFLVEDEGPGVPPGERARIFEPFYSTKGPSKGTGLGLAIVQRVARDHGGEVTCHDRPGGGACFVLCLPPAPEGTQPGAPPRLPPAPRGAFARVLVVDDEALLREAMAEALRHAGHTVHEAAHAEAAFVLAARDTYDVLVTDVLMPGISGVELAKRLSLRQPALRVILVTGFLREEDRWPGWSDEWRVVEKPFRADEVVRVVATLVRDPAAPVAEDSAVPAG